MMSIEDQTELAARLYARVSEAIPLRMVEARIGECKPEPQRCHANAVTWAEYNPGFKAVHGWLCADYRVLGKVAFIAHSVVEDQAGELLDITPVHPVIRWRYPFLRDERPTADYLRMIKENGRVEVTHILRP